MQHNHIHDEVDALQRRYVAALDTKDLQAWLACFDDQGGYICTTAENAGSDLPIAVMMDDSPARLKDRVKYIEKVWAGTFEDYSTRHFIQRTATDEGKDIVNVETNFLISYVARDGLSSLLCSGIYRDKVVLTPAGARFRRKVAVMDAAIMPRYLVYPI